MPAYFIEQVRTKTVSADNIHDAEDIADDLNDGEWDTTDLTVDPA